MRIPREDLLSQLEAIEPGLSQKDLIEQGRHFIFLKKRIVTFNSEVACTIATTLDARGAVRSTNLLAILRMLKEEHLEIEQNSKNLIIRGKNKKTGVAMDKKVVLPIGVVEKPKEWHPLAESFCEAIEIAVSCVSKKASDYISTCVHVHPNFLEASDNVQVTRYNVKTKLKNSVLIVGTNLKYVAEAEVTEFSMGKTWMHFRNPQGLIISCRTSSSEEYPNLDAAFNVKGEKAVLPKGLADAAGRAQVFSSENLEKDRVEVNLRPGQIQIRGEGVGGWHIEARKIDYEGVPLSFIIAPSVLMDIVSRHNECIISDKFLKVDTGAYEYMTCLGKISKKKKKKKKGKKK